MVARLGLILALRTHARRRAFFGATLAALCGVGALADGFDDQTPTESEVACVTTRLLVGAEFSQPPLDDALSTRFLDGYLDALDVSRDVFLQTDVDEFSWFRPDLAQTMAAQGDTWPAHMIYARFLKRLNRRVNFQTNFLQTAAFDFTGGGAWQPDHRVGPRPRDLAAARLLWENQVRADYRQEKLSGLPPANIVSKLTQHYERRLKILSSLTANELLEIYLDSLARAFDPHSDYFGHEAAQDFASEINLSLDGIGGSLESGAGGWVMGDLVPGGPAARSGLLHPGDRILAVAQGDGEPEEVTDLPVWHVIDLIRGAKGSTVRLVIAPIGESSSARKTVSLVREDIRLTNNCAQAAVVDWPQSRKVPLRLGVIDLPTFYEKSAADNNGAAADTARLITKLKQAGIAGLILDLRRNGGGSLKEAIDLSGLFISSGPVVQTRDPAGHIEVLQSSASSALYAGPLVILTSRFSASSSELVAGALQDYGRAVIVGDSATFGKGTVQIVLPLRNLVHAPGFGSVKVTVAKFYRPSGASTQLKGVTPDIVLPSETDLPSLGEAQLPNPMPWDAVARASYTNLDQVRPVLAALRSRASARIAANPGFRRLRDKLAGAVEETAGQPLVEPPAEVSAAGKGADDLDLREAENILADYIQLRVREKGIASLIRPDRGLSVPKRATRF